MEVTDTARDRKEKVSDFESLRRIGRGSFGTVFLVQKTVGSEANTLYAMKVLEKKIDCFQCSTRATRERSILTKVRHPFVVQLHYTFQTRENLYFILDFFRGGDLFDLLDQKLTEKAAMFYLAEVTLALGYLHSLNVIYRDLKPENVLLGADGHISLTDFGMSVQLSSGEKKAFSINCGTLNYQSPEIISRQGHSFATDWWSYGVLMLEMLTGKNPFERGVVTMKTIMSAEVEIPNDISSDAQSLIRSLLKRNPDERLNSEEDVKNHSFFAPIDWTRLLNKGIEPPFKPTVKEERKKDKKKKEDVEDSYDFNDFDEDFDEPNPKRNLCSICTEQKEWFIKESNELQNPLYNDRI